MPSPEARSDRNLGIGLVVTSAVAFGGLGVFARIADDEGADRVAVLALRFGIAAVVFGGFRLVARAARPRGRVLGGLVVMGVLYFVQGSCFFASVERGSPGLASLLLYAYPVLVVAASALLFGDRPSRSVVGACFVAVCGTALIVAPSVGDGSTAAILFGLATAGTYTAYILIGSRVLVSTDAVWASTVIMAAAALCCVVQYLATSPRPDGPGTGDGWAAVLALALISTVLAVSTFLGGLARVGPATASTLSALEPATSVVLSAIVIGETLTAVSLIGGVLVLGSVIAISRLAPTTELVEAAPPA